MDVLAELADAWGWGPAELDACVWWYVPRLLEEARKQRAVRLQEGIVAQRSQGDHLKKLMDRLERIIMGPKDYRIQEAERLETWADLAGGERAKKLRERATYLRTCYRRGIEVEEGIND